MSRLIAVRRAIVPADHEGLRKHMYDINHAIPEAQIKWRKLGKVGLELVSVRDYKKATGRHGSNLAQADPKTLAKTLNNGIIPKMPTESRDTTVAVDRVGFTGHGPYANISLLLVPDGIREERSRMTGLLDKLNGISTPWLTFEPEIVLATLDWHHADDNVLEQFAAIKPPTVRVLGARATTA